MFQSHGLWWPDVPAVNGMAQAYLKSADDMILAMSFVKKFDIVIQAGGHCGEWARWLARRFNTVYTFEPDAANFKCLVRNIEDFENIFAAHGFLGDSRGPINLFRSSEPSLGGSHHGLREIGRTPVYRIDDMRLPSCDALILDVEGMELPILNGARETIRRFFPVIQVENHPPFAEYGWGCLDDILTLLFPRYRIAGHINYDIVLVPE